MSTLSIVRATAADVDAIAHLHAASWRATYAGALPAAYLDQQMACEHTTLWRSRLMGGDDPALCVWKACGGRGAHPLIGFACALSGVDGILLDNLHVDTAAQHQGVGSALFARVRDWACSVDARAPLYLWVLASNGRARRFYDGLGGTAGDVHPISLSPGLEIPAVRYVWSPYEIALERKP